MTVRVHIKLDTGMSRIGFFCQGEQGIIDTVDEVERFAACRDYIEVYSPILHRRTRRRTTNIPCASLRDFEGDGGLDLKGIKLSIRHCCNSAATMRFRICILIWCAGIILWACSVAVDGRNPALQPAMELKTVYP